MGLIVAAKTVITVALAEAPSLSHFVIYAQSLPLTPAIHAPSLHLVTVIPAPNLPQVAVTHAPSLPPVIVIPAEAGIHSQVGWVTCSPTRQGCKECISAVGKMPEKQQKA